MTGPLRFLVLPLCFAAVFAVAALPEVIHTLDHGSATVTVEQLLSGPPSSRNLLLTAIPKLDLYVRQTVTRKDSQVSPETSLYFPLVSPGWTAGEPVHVVGQAFESVITDIGEESAHGREVPLQGTLRNVAWEGLSDEVRALFESNGQPLAKEVLVVELKRLRTDHLKAFGFPLLGAVLGLLAASVRLTPGKQKDVEGRSEAA